MNIPRDLSAESVVSQLQFKFREHSATQVLARVQAVALLLDAVSIAISFWAAFELRYTYRIGAMVPNAQDTLGLSQWFRHSVLAIVVSVVIFSVRGVYQTRRRVSLGEGIPLVVTSFVIAIAVIVLVAFFVQFSPSRAIYGYSLILGTTLLVGHRAVMKVILNRLFERGVGVERVLIAGESENARRLSQSLLGQSHWGYQLVGMLSSGQVPHTISVATGSGIRLTRHLGHADDFERVLEEHNIDGVFIVEADHTSYSIDQMIEACRSHDVRFWMVPSLLQMSIDRAQVSELNGIPLLGVSDASIQGWDAFVKRALDLVVSSTLLAILAIPFALIAGLIRLDSPGGSFYKQIRVGQNGATFKMIKFRTMVADADARRIAAIEEVSGDHRLFKDRRDSRITNIGAVLRKFSIDELPQIWNVFRGEMSLVGPRPALSSEVSIYESWHLQRLLVRPGMTGLWQVSGRSDLNFDQMVRLDLYYAENWTIWFDVSILLRTLPAVVFGRGAY